MWSNLRRELARASVDRGAVVDREYIVWLQLVEARYSMDDRSADLYLLALLGLVHPKAWRRRVDRLGRSVHVSRERTETVARSCTMSPLLGYTADFCPDSVVKKTLWREVTNRIFHVNATAHKKDDPSGHIPAETELIRRINENGIDLSSMDLRTPIRIECDTSNGNLQQIMMLAMAQSVRNLPMSGDHQRQRFQRQRFQRHAAFRLHEVDLDEESFMDWADLQCAKSIVECGVRLRVFPRLLCVMDEVVVMETAFSAFQVLFPTDRDSRVGVECVHLSAEMAPELVPALLSAVRVCPSVRTVTVTASLSHRDDHHPRFWPWLAYMLSGRGERHQIDTVMVNGAISPTDIAAMRKIIQAANPLAALYGEDAASQPRGRIEARRFHLLDPSINSAQASAWTSPRLIKVDVIDGGDVWWSVLLHGFGRAWVHRESIVHHTAYDTLPVAHQVHRFEHSTNVSDIHELELAVKLWGASLTMLISKTDAQLEPEWMEWVQEACPSLQQLVLPSAMLLNGCLRAIVSMRLHTLEACFVPSGDTSDFIHFFSTLRDENHACTIALTTLRLRVMVKQQQDLEFVTTLATMLEENRTLTTVSLEIEDSGYNGHQGAAIGAMISSAPGRVQRREIDAPVRRKCRLAFLSAMHHQPSESAINRLDSSVLTMIFGFAVHRITRQLEFRYKMLQ